MKNVLRVLRLSLKYRATLIGVLLCSLLVAGFWGGNIGALYPVFEIISQGRSLQQWVKQEVAQGQAKVTRLEQELAGLTDAPPGADAAKHRRTIEACEIRLAAERKALAHAERLQPLIERYLPDDPFRTLVILIALLLVATAVKDLCIVMSMVMTSSLVERITLDVRKMFFHHTLRMDLATFGKEGPANLIGRFNADTSAVGSGLGVFFGTAVREPLKMAACLGGAAFISWRLLLLSLVLTPLIALVLKKLAGSIKRAHRRAMEDYVQLHEHLSETYHGIQTVQAYTMEKQERARFHRLCKECLLKAVRIVFYNSLTKPATEVLGIGVVCIAVLSGCWLVLNQETHILGLRMSDRPLSLPSLLVFYGLLVGATDPARKMSDVFNNLQAGMAAADRLFPLLDQEPQIVDPPAPRELPRPHSKLTFDHIAFHYQPTQPVLRDVSLEIRHGETICIVGSNGCGKTTLVNLLPRFYDPVSGSVRLDDVDVRSVRLRDLRERIGLVTQHNFLFNDTVAANIRYGSPQATDDEVIAAAKQAHAHDFILEKLEHGYETLVGPGGGRLSGGQRQRIALARVILRNPDILILDEATSQVDLQSERLIHDALSQFVVGRTAIIITHRLSTLDLADRIVVMHEGRIADVGTHQELLARCRLYRQLQELQFRDAA